MKKLFKTIVTIFFFVLPVLLLGFVSMLSNAMRWQIGSPLVPGYNWMRWSHLYLILGLLFCFILYIPIIVSIIKKKQRILFIPLFAAIVFVIFSIVFVGISKKVYYNQIIQKCEEEIKENPFDSAPLERKATAYDELGDYEKAIQLFSEAIELSSKPAYVIHDRGMSYINNQEYGKAIEDFTEAMALNPSESNFVAQCYNDRGVAYFHNGDYDKSWQDVDRAMDMGYSVHPGFLAALEEKGYRR